MLIWRNEHVHVVSVTWMIYLVRVPLPELTNSTRISMIIVQIGITLCYIKKTYSGSLNTVGGKEDWIILEDIK